MVFPNHLEFRGGTEGIAHYIEPDLATLKEQLKESIPEPQRVNGHNGKGWMSTPGGTPHSETLEWVFPGQSFYSRGSDKGAKSDTTMGHLHLTSTLHQWYPPESEIDSEKVCPDHGEKSALNQAQVAERHTDGRCTVS